MKSKADGVHYNERLFTGGLRRFLHLARFRFLRDFIITNAVKHDSVLELGCYDGKLLNFLPRKPTTYVGYDANWEGGLDLAVSLWSSVDGYRFKKAEQPSDIDLHDELFELTVCMETLEHVPPALVDGYLQRLAQHTRGYLFVTVPNEKGPLFLAKYLAKALLSKDAKPYSWSELVHATLGRMEGVERNEHKGFDYAQLVRQIGRHFDVVEVSGHPLRMLPAWACFGIAIVAKSMTSYCGGGSTHPAQALEGEACVPALS
jgi:2-polyprenyl-3-methyl-5-hydroxy-6-metoxy-1,4-benzoquinol methylase